MKPKKQIQLQRKIAKTQRLVKAVQFTTEDRKCEYMVMAGMSNRAIRNELKITDYEIYKIQKAANLRKTDYRDAISPVGKAMVKKLTELSERRLAHHIERYLLR